MSETGYVYTLDDPRSGDPRYVGKTTYPEQRFRSHVANPHNDRLEEWISELDSAGLSPEMSLIRVAEGHKLNAKERKLIQQIGEEFELLNANLPEPYPDFDSSEGMSASTADMKIDDRDRAVLSVLAEGRGNPYLIREETGLNKGDVNTVLNRLGRGGYLRQVTRGLYEITEKGQEVVDDGDVE